MKKFTIYARTFYLLFRLKVGPKFLTGLSFVLWFWLNSLFTYGQQVKDTALAGIINRMAARDQQVQQDFINAKSDSVRRVLEQEIQRTFAANCTKLQAITSRQPYPHGYPGHDLVGKQAAHNFWLLIQHCDREPAFQEVILKQMQEQVKRNNADKKDYAYLTDRVRINKLKPQLYGTQVEVKDILKGYVPKPIEAPEK